MPGVTDLLATVRGLHPRTIDLSLERINTLIGELGNPQDSLAPVIHIAGTNGKGSTLAYLRAMFEADGKVVHAYTSPHLSLVWDGITVAGQVITEDRFAGLLSEILTVNGQRPLTEFEALTIAAFLAFARTPADVVLLETGLGGTLDATNVVTRPSVTAITPISMDHMDFLGNDQKSIAEAKAGILKAETPCVMTAQQQDVTGVFRDRARELDIPLLMENRDWQFEAAPEGFTFAGIHGRASYGPPGLAGVHQLRNASLALAVLDVFYAFKVSPAARANGIATAHWPGRLQHLPDFAGAPAGFDVWLDGGHNQDAGRILSGHARQFWQDRPLYVVCAMLANKDATAFLEGFEGLAQNVITLTIPQDPRSRDAESLATLANSVGLDASPAENLQAAMNRLGTSPPGRILICGSLSLAGKVLS